MLPAAFDTGWPGCKLGRSAKAAPREKARMNEDDAKNERDISESACCFDHGTCQLDMRPWTAVALRLNIARRDLR
jgi:hypothetical protein